MKDLFQTPFFAAEIEKHQLNPNTLLEHAMRQQPESLDLIAAWARHRARYFDYCIHEIPHGVLYNHNGANVEECGELLELLTIFERRVNVLDEPDYNEKIALWRYSFESYQGYLRSRASGKGLYNNFGDFLKKHPMKAYRAPNTGRG